MTKKHFHEIICSNCDSSFWINDAYSYFNNKQVCSNCKSEIRTGNNGLNEQILIYIKRKASVRAIKMVKDARKCSMRAAKKQVKAVAKENNIKINTDVTPVLNFFLRIIFIDMNTGFASGYMNNNGKSVIYKTTNAGLNWNRKDFLYTGNIIEINFFNASTGVAIGNSGTNYIGTKIFRTTNTGNTWDSIMAVANVVPMFIKVLNGTGTSFAGSYFTYDTSTVFTRTYTFKSTDYGLTWITKNFSSSNLMTGCSLIDQNNFFMCGGDFFNTAVILKSTNGGNVYINQTGSEIPAEFSLSQNYPNPFNPKTIIRFQIKDSRFVTLKIFDILGKEIATLVNEKQSPGTYEVTFDGSGLNSGIYFYKLQADNFSEIKKMVLIK